MRPIYITLPAGLALASAGGLMMLQAQQPHVSGAPKLNPKTFHAITEKMQKEAKSWAAKPAPGFETEDFEGKPVTIASPQGRRPQFVYFIMDGCPCSVEVEPLFQDLAKRYKERIEFVSVIDQDKEKARRWSVEMLSHIPVVPDPSKKIIKAYEATNSAFSALVSEDGRILKMWPGYSVDILKEMNEMMAKAAGIQAKPFDTKWAPKKPSAGCAF